MKRPKSKKVVPKFHVYRTHEEAEESALKKGLERSPQERIDFMYHLINLSIQMNGGKLKPKKGRKPDLYFKLSEKHWGCFRKEQEASDQTRNSINP